jgi:hypothetical protein
MSKDGSCVGLAWWSVSAQNTHVKARREFDGQAVLTVCHGCVDGLTDEARVCNYGLLGFVAVVQTCFGVLLVTTLDDKRGEGEKRSELIVGDEVKGGVRRGDGRFGC